MNYYKKKYLKYKLKYLHFKNNSKIHNNLIEKYKSKLKLIKGGTDFKNYLEKNNLNYDIHDVPDDGNCQFSAIISQLNYIDINNWKLEDGARKSIDGVKLDPYSLRLETVKWLRLEWLRNTQDTDQSSSTIIDFMILNIDDFLTANKYTTSGHDNYIEDVLDKNLDEKMKIYLDTMEKEKTFGDQITILAIVELLKININLYNPPNHIPISFEHNHESPTINIGFVEKMDATNNISGHYISLLEKKEAEANIESNIESKIESNIEGETKIESNVESNIKSNVEVEGKSEEKIESIDHNTTSIIRNTTPIILVGLISSFLLIYFQK